MTDWLAHPGQGRPLSQPALGFLHTPSIPEVTPSEGTGHVSKLQEMREQAAPGGFQIQPPEGYKVIGMGQVEPPTVQKLWVVGPTV